MRPGHRGKKVAVASPCEGGVTHGARQGDLPDGKGWTGQTWCGVGTHFMLVVQGRVTCLECIANER